MTKCPCCGSEVKKDILVCLDTNTVVRKGHDPLRLFLVPISLLKILVDYYPATIPHERLITRVWGSFNEVDQTINLRTQLCLLRRKIKYLGLRIINVHGIGYRLEIRQ